jgi:hypothetical protein
LKEKQFPQCQEITAETFPVEGSIILLLCWIDHNEDAIYKARKNLKAKAAKVERNNNLKTDCQLSQQSRKPVRQKNDTVNAVTQK